MAPLFFCVLFVAGGSYAMHDTEVNIDVLHQNSCPLEDIESRSPNYCSGLENDGRHVKHDGYCIVTDSVPDDGDVSFKSDSFEILVCHHGHWSATDSSVGLQHHRHKRFWFFIGFAACLFFCRRRGGRRGGGTTIVTKYPPTFPGCIPSDLQGNYNVPAGESGVIVTWTEPIATDRNGGTPSVSQVGGESANGGMFQGTIYGKTHHITYEAKDSDGLTGHCYFSFTVTILTCNSLPWPNNGARTCENNYILGSSCQYNCDNGYQISGSDVVTCQNEMTPTWSPVPACEKTKCSSPSAPSNSSFQCLDPTYQYQSVCMIDCDDGFSLDGPRLIQCQADGTWSNTGLSTCIDNSPPTITCATPQIFYADRALTTTSVTWQEPTALDNTDTHPTIVKTDGPSIGAVLEVGSEIVQYKAIDSEGNESPKCFIELRVEEKVCRHPGDTFNHNYLVFDCSTPGYVFGTSCTLSCLANLPLNGTDLITCEDDGSSEGFWSWGTGEKPYCREIACPELDPPINGLLAYDSVLTRPLYILSCNDQFDIPIMSASSNFDGKFFCTDDGDWTPFESVPGCIVPIDPRFLQLPAEIFYYGGECGSEETISDIEEHFQAILENHVQTYFNTICPAGETCTAENIIISCGEISSRKKRSLSSKYDLGYLGRRNQYRRNANVHNIEKRQAETHLLTVRFYIVVVLNFDNSTLTDVVEKYDNIQLNILKPAVQEMINNGTFDLDGFVLKSDSFQSPDYGLFACDSGYLLDRTKCHPCPVGYFLNETTETCEVCPVGQYRDTESDTTCTICPSRYSTKQTASTSQDECVKLCSPGSYSPDTVESCSPCLHGYYQDEYGQNSCKECPAGTTTESTNSSSASDCKSSEVILENTDGELIVSTISTTMTSITFMFWSKRFDDQHSDAVLRLTNNGAQLFNVYLTENIRVEIPSLLDETIGYHSCSVWTHIAITWDTINKRIIVYVNGATVYTLDAVNAPSVPLVENSTLVVGSSGQTGVYMTGLHLFEDVLSEEDITRHSASCSETETEDVINMGVFSDMVGEHGVSTTVSSSCDANDTCLTSPCNGHLCTNGQDGFTCTCVGGWSGTTCAIPPDMCVDNSCENGATCQNGNTSYWCTCLPGYSGSLCEVHPVDGGWSEWVSVTECSQSCGSGTQSRSRNCDSPTPDTYGIDCAGDTTEVTSCNTEDCPVCTDFEVHGGTLLNCTTNETTGNKTCEVYCEDGMILPSDFSEFQTFTCGPDTNYVWDSMENLPKCVGVVGPDDASITVTLDYTSLIPESSEQSVLDAITNNLEATPCYVDPNCQFEIAIIESNKDDQGVVSTVQVTFTTPLLLGPDLKYGEYVSDGTVSASLQELSDVILNLESTATYIQNYTSEIFDVTTNGATYTIDADSLAIDDVLSCDVGYTAQNGFCLPCPSGSYSGVGACNFCEKGTYQPNEGQTSCLTCQSGLTTITIGSSDISQCTEEVESSSTISTTSYEPTSSRPDPYDEDDKTTTTIAIAISTVALIIAITALAIVYFKKIRPRLRIDGQVPGGGMSMPYNQRASWSITRAVSAVSRTSTLYPDCISITECRDYDLARGSDGVISPDIRSHFVRMTSRNNLPSDVVLCRSPPPPYEEKSSNWRKSPPPPY